MQDAKAAVSDVLSNHGKHDTTVHENVNNAVTNENVTRTQHEEATKAIDREIHQDHYHTKVQNIHDKEVLPEKHHHKQVGVEHKSFEHGHEGKLKERLEAEAAQFKPTREVGDTQHTASEAPTAVGEHVHHHVHENIQPVIHKETVQPSVVHTTVPVHEVHHNEPKHHAATALPSMSMAEFKNQGGSLGGQERTDAFSGEPKPHNGLLGGRDAAGTTSVTEKGLHSGTSHEGHHGHHGHHTGTVNEETATGTTGHHAGSAHDEAATGTAKKPSLLDKLNPKKDADGDGHAGFMS